MSKANQEYFKSLKTQTYTDTPVQGNYGSEIIFLTINNTGTTVVNTRTDKTIRIWRVERDKLIETKTIPQAHEKAVERVSWHPKYENTFATVGRDQYVKIWRGINGSLDQEIIVHKKNGTSCVNQFVDYSEDGEIMVIVDRDSTISFLSVNNNYEKVYEVKIEEHVYDFKWFNSGHKFFMLALHNGTVPIYEFKEDGSGITLKTTFAGHRSSITSIAVDPKGHCFVVGSNEGVVSIYRTKDMVIEGVIDSVDQAVSSVGISKDGAYVSVTYDSTENSKIFDRNTRTEMHEVGNSLSGKSVLPNFCWFPKATSYVYSSGYCGSMTYASR